jgi:sterol desaturase/sphingolipid hydroxylase (fatty acid hydroxylase superfamily)
MVTDLLRQVLTLLGLGVPFFIAEQRFAAHGLSYRKVFARDVGAVTLVALLGIPTAAVLGAFFSCFPALAVLRLPMLPPWASFPLAIVASDFAMYWTHRLVHTRPLWRVHRWHHAPRHLYWLAGGRASFLQGIVYAIPTFVFVLLNVPLKLIGMYIMFGVVLNHWMHSNLRLKSEWLEAVLITPRIHHVHHSSDPRHYGRNLGSLLSIWDRMFGTFLDPDDVKAPLKFGIPEAVSGPRMVVGL